MIHRPFLLLAGAYFLVDLLPQPFRFLAMVNPLAYAIDAFRGSLSSSTLLLPQPVECVIAAGPTVLIGVVGVWVFRRVLDRQLRSGELSLYWRCLVAAISQIAANERRETERGLYPSDSMADTVCLDSSMRLRTTWASCWVSAW